MMEIKSNSTTVKKLKWKKKKTPFFKKKMKCYLDINICIMSSKIRKVTFV
jgi:hypothetical protein